MPDRRIPENENELREATLRIHRKSRGRYGRPRILHLLHREGFKVSSKRVARIMREEGIRGCRGRKRGPRHTSIPAHTAAPNLVNRRFDVDAPNEVWAGDVTQVHVGGVWLYLAVVIDMYSRRVVGWHTSTSAETGLVTSALKMAAKDWLSLDGLIFHSDQGSVYGSERFREQLTVLGITQSMSRRGNCWDNAPAESFFATLKTELIHEREWTCLDELRREVAAYLAFYNDERIHSSLGYLTPSEYEQRAAA
jgi:transposase InsO family protein